MHPVFVFFVSGLAADGAPASILSCIAQLFFDAQELVVLGNPVRASRGAGLDLAHVQGNGQVGNGGVSSGGR